MRKVEASERVNRDRQLDVADVRCHTLKTTNKFNRQTTHCMHTLSSKCF